MFKPTNKQILAKVYLKLSRIVICLLLRWHHKIAEEWGIDQHPCWAGGFGPNGIEKQSCNICDPFYADHCWTPSQKEVRGRC